MDHDTAVLVAKISLASAVMGGLIALFSNVVVAVIQKWANASVAKREMAQTTKTAKRLVRNELQVNLHFIQTSIGTGRWWHSRLEISTAEWKEHNHSLARSLGDDDWEHVVKAYSNLIILEVMPKVPAAFEDARLPVLASVLEDAINALSPN